MRLRQVEAIAVVTVLMTAVFDLSMFADPAKVVFRLPDGSKVSELL